MNTKKTKTFLSYVKVFSNAVAAFEVVEKKIDF